MNRADGAVVAAEDLDDASWDRLSGLVQRFESAWARCARPELSAFLPDAGDALRARALTELVKVDQEFRWRAGERRMLEAYLDEWPELGEPPQRLLELLAAECLTRGILEATPDRAELRRRFGALGEQVPIEQLEREASGERSLAGANDTSRPLDATARTLGPRPVPLQVGQRLGRYEIREFIGRGGMGAVYRASDTQLGRDVALKVPRLDATSDPVLLERFVREARAAAAIRHPYVCPVYDAGQIDGTFYITMAFVPGRTLAAVLQERPLAPGDSAAIARKLAEALASVHAAKVIHRDIKPSNVMIDERGEPLLMDFGLARAMHSLGDGDLAASGSLVGTPAFIPPEQLGPEPRAIDARGDIYSLGVLLYQMITGRLPYTGPLGTVLQQIRTAEPAAPIEINPAINPALDAICRQAMSRAPQARYQSAGEMAAALAAFAAAEPATDSRRPRPVPVLWATAAAAMLLILGGIVGQQWIVRIRDREGRIRDIPVPPGGTAEILPAKEPSPSRVPPLRPGSPLSPMALVAQPAVLANVQSWTIESRGHRGDVLAVAARPDGKLLATGGIDATIRLWDPESGRLVSALLGHAEPVRALGWSPDGRVLASGSFDATLRLWLAERGELLRILRGHRGQVRAVAWSADSRSIASASSDGTVRIWQAESGSTSQVIETDTERATAVAWSPKGGQVAFGAGDGVVRLWNVETAAACGELRGHTGSVSAIEWSPDGDLLASAAQDATVRVWRAGAGELVQTYREHRGAVSDLVWLVDGERLASADASGMVRLSNARTGQTTGILHEPDESGEVFSIAAIGSRRLACSTTGRASVRLWDVTTGRRTGTIPGHYSITCAGVAWAHHAAALAYGNGDGTVRLWDAQAAEPARIFEGHARDVQAVAWSPDDTMLASAGGDETVRIWDIGSGQAVRTLSGHSGPIHSAVWSPDGRLLATAGGDRDIRVWDTQSWQVRVQLAGHSAAVRSLAWSRSGKRLASAGDDATVRLWDTALGRTVSSLAGHEKRVCAVAWSPDESMCASAGDDLKVRLHHATDGQLLGAFGGHEHTIAALAWSPVGNRLASAGWFNTIRLWDPKAGRAVGEPVGHSGAVLALAWSADGRLLASGSEDGTVRVWQDGSTPVRTLVAINNNHTLALSGSGGYRGTPQIDRELVVVVQTNNLQQTLTPGEFVERYRWSNDDAQ
jgi:WD40 repeat protein